MVISFLDLLFPKRCVSCGKLGSYVCKNCFSKIEFIEKPVCPICGRQAIGGKTHLGCSGRFRLDGLVVACRYKGAVKRAIAKVKYRWVFDIGKTLVDLVTLNLWRFELPKEVTLVPIPLHLSRERWRGFNQAEFLAKILAKEFGVESLDLLVRIGKTQSQVGLDKKARRANVKGAFSLKNGQDVLDKNILLIDDVYTSGATMAEAASVLKRAEARGVWGKGVALG